MDYERQKYEPQKYESQKSRYIAVEGPIGVGKSSLAKKLSQSLKADLILEEPKANPFLVRYYSKPRQYALPTQLNFLFQRLKKLQKSQQDDLFSGGMIVDFMIEKDPLFAQITLDDDEYRLYQEVYKNMKIKLPTPDLVIYLQASEEVLSERVEKRGVRYEKDISKRYLKKLADAYTAFFYHYNQAPLLIVNAEDMNFVENEAHYTALLEQVNTIQSGKNYFNPLIESL